MLEDEFHFVLECQAYADLRITYINKYYWQRPNFVKCVRLLNNEKPSVTRNLAIYVYKAFDRRRTLFTA